MDDPRANTVDGISETGPVRPASFVPPSPVRHDRLPPVWKLIGLARRSFLSVWTKDSFWKPWLRIRLLRKQIFVCNSPDTVQEAFQRKNGSFERKSAQMRHALEPLLGDGLFISDGRDLARAPRHRRPDHPCLAVA